MMYNFYCFIIAAKANKNYNQPKTVPITVQRNFLYGKYNIVKTSTKRESLLDSFL